MTEWVRETTEWGYARVSTTAQALDAQRDALLAAGIDQDRIVVEKVSGAKKERPELDALLERVGAGDRITVWRLDRLGRSLSHLVATVENLTKRGVEFRSLQEGIDASTASGRMTMHIFAALAEFERELNQERTRAALDAARARQATRSPLPHHQRTSRTDLAPARGRPITGTDRSRDRRESRSRGACT